MECGKRVGCTGEGIHEFDDQQVPFQRASTLVDKIWMDPKALGSLSFTGVTYNKNQQKLLVASLLLVAMPFAPSGFLY